MLMRKLASIRMVNDVSPIEGADAIEVATVDSWKVVVRKGEVTIGSLVVYFEIDSWIPTTLAPFLSKGVPKKYQEIEGERLKTIKLRGQISQGLVMNISDVIKVVPDFESKVSEANSGNPFSEGQDVSDILGIIKWELPSSVGTFQTKGNFPSFIPKTDQERIQNLTKKFSEIKGEKWEITEKYDGSSMTVYFFKVFDTEKIQEGVCSRNLDLKIESEEGGPVNSFWEIAIREKLLEKLQKCGMNVAIQGELVGEKINNNIYKLTKRDFWLFDIYNIDTGKYFTPMERQTFAKMHGIKHVPVLFNDFEFPEEMTIDEVLKLAEGKSVLNPSTEREGLVFKNTKHGQGKISSFKAISNNYLMKIG
jgi:RNA ligase (TIGR02306 family)